MTEVGRLAAEENRRLARQHPQFWAQLRSSYQAYSESFGRLASPQQIRSLAISQAIGETLSAASGRGGGFFAEQIRSAGGNMTSDAASAYVEATHQKFAAEIARGGNVGSAAEKAAHIGQFAAAPKEAAALRQIAELTPDNVRLAEIASSNRAALYVSDQAGNPERVRGALARVARTTGSHAPVQLADSLVSFEDYFPGDRATSSVRAGRHLPARSGCKGRCRRQAARHEAMHGGPRLWRPAPCPTVR